MDGQCLRRLDDFKWVKETFQFNKDFIQNYNNDSDEGYFLEVHVQYPENLHNLHNDLPLLPEIMKIDKVEKLASNLHDKKEHVIHIKKIKTSTKSWTSIVNSIKKLG